MGSFWGNLGVLLGSYRGHLEAILRSYGVSWGSYKGQVGSFGGDLGVMWCHIGVILGSYWVNLYLLFSTAKNGFVLKIQIFGT